MVCTGMLYANYIISWLILMTFQTGISCKWTNDSKQFILENFNEICCFPDYIYHYALPFCPSSSWFQVYYCARFLQSVKVVKGNPTQWGACSRTVLLEQTPCKLSYGHNIIAVGLASGDILFLDGVTGTQTAVLSGHSGWITCLVFSLDVRSLVSGAGDKTVKLWDVQTGGVVRTFYGPTHSARSVSISADSRRIASGGWGGETYLWNIETGEQISSTQLGSEYIYLIPNNAKHLLSILDNTCKWDVGGYKVISIPSKFNLYLSPDCSLFALSNGQAVTVQSSSSGAVVSTLYLSGMDDCCFSPDGRVIAVSSVETTYVCNITSFYSHLIKTLYNCGQSIIFSSPSNLISIVGCKDSLKFWQIGSLAKESVVVDPMPAAPSLAPIRSVSLQKRDKIALTSDLTGVVKIWNLLTGHCKASFQTPASQHSLGDAQLIDDRLIFAWKDRTGIYIWDSKHSKPDQVLEITMDLLSPDGKNIERSHPWESNAELFERLPDPSLWVNVNYKAQQGTLGLRISEDGSVVHGFDLWSIQTWSVPTCRPVGSIEVAGNPPYLDPLSTGSSRTWICSKDTPSKKLDCTVLGSSLTLSLNTSLERPHLDVVHNTLSGTNSCLVKDTVTGKEVLRLLGKYEKPSCVQWDGQYLIAGYDNGEVLILDFQHLCLD